MPKAFNHFMYWYFTNKLKLLMAVRECSYSIMSDSLVQWYGNTLVLINLVNLRRAWLVLVRVTVRQFLSG